MAVQFADKALDEGLTDKINEHRQRYEACGYVREQCYMYALMEAQQQLHEFWGASLEPEDD
jgi:hypothetical protein